jgi:hypothetical protein
VLAQSMSGLTTIFKVSNKGDGSDSAVHSDGDIGRICPHCGCPMKHCDPPADVEWICHNCGYSVMR